MTLIPDRYLVTLDPAYVAASGQTVAQLADGYASTYNGTVVAVFTSALQGFSVDMSAEDAAALANADGVDMVEQDQTFTSAAVAATYGLDRIDQVALPLDGQFTVPGGWTGAGVDLYFLDGGIKTTHTEFSGRASQIFQSSTVSNWNGVSECDGMKHGTIVATIAAGATHGVAPGATLYAARVMNCAGGIDGTQFVLGMDAVAQHHTNKNVGQPAANKRPSVANMSLQGIASATTCTAVTGMINAGIIVCTAAGNVGQVPTAGNDSSLISPCNCSGVICVAASDRIDNRWLGTCYGSAVSIYAPGRKIVGADYLSTTAFLSGELDSGTSYACPFVTGAAALWLHANLAQYHDAGPSGDAIRAALPGAIRTAILNNARTNRISNPGASTINKIVDISTVGVVSV